jgi:Holliday junction resolvasome RuvABC endonuclease subunit
MKVLGADLSLTSTGLAIAQKGRLAEVQNFKTSGKRGDGYPEFLARIGYLTGCVSEFLKATGHLDLAVIEAPSHGSRFGNPHERAGLWWNVYDLLAQRGVPIATVAPKTRAKYITGSGNSGKDVVLAHAIEHYVTTGTARITNDDEADAAGLAAMGARRLGEPIELHDMHKDNLAAMETAKWPAT